MSKYSQEIDRLLSLQEEDFVRDMFEDNFLRDMGGPIDYDELTAECLRVMSIINARKENDDEY